MTLAGSYCFSLIENTSYNVAIMTVITQAIEEIKPNLQNT